VQSESESRRYRERFIRYLCFFALLLLAIGERKPQRVTNPTSLPRSESPIERERERGGERMSGRGGGSSGKGSNGISAIPAASRKMVQSLKEIVHNCTEQEIYAALKDCNMDPNEAVNRLLSQGPFFFFFFFWLIYLYA